MFESFISDYNGVPLNLKLFLNVFHIKFLQSHLHRKDIKCFQNFSNVLHGMLLRRYEDIKITMSDPGLTMPPPVAVILFAPDTSCAS